MEEENFSGEGKNCDKMILVTGGNGDAQKY
jgi:hypothetical protein